MVGLIICMSNSVLYHLRYENYLIDSKYETKWIYVKSKCSESSEAKIECPFFVTNIQHAHVCKKYYSLFDSCIKICNSTDPLPCFNKVYDNLGLSDEILRPMYDSINIFSHDFALLHNADHGRVGQYDILVKGYHQDSSIVEFVYYVDTNVRLESVSGYVLREHVHDQPAPTAWQRRTNAYLDSLDKLGGHGKRSIK